MRRNLGTSLLASILVYGVAVVVVLVGGNQANSEGSFSRVTAATVVQQDEGEQADDEQADDEQADDEQADDEQADVGQGPPAWAHANDKRRGNGAAKEWKESWQKLTPAQKSEKMTGLVKAHEQGMKKWADCVAAGRNASSKRGECMKPLPPGLAKKLP